MPALPTPLRVSLYCWFALEVALVVRDLVRGRGRLGGDRGTRAVVALSLGAAIMGGWLIRRWVPALDTPAPDAFAVSGAGLMLVGVAGRLWAVITLGGSFSTYIRVDAGQAVVSRGPYRWVRHPSYTGLLLVTLGFGVGVGNWLSIVACAIVPLVGLVPRIAVEEAELIRVLGDQYRGYQRDTRRLLPGLW